MARHYRVKTVNAGKHGAVHMRVVENGRTRRVLGEALSGALFLAVCALMCALAALVGF